jgi:hypothetical protein
VSAPAIATIAAITAAAALPVTAPSSATAASVRSTASRAFRFRASFVHIQRAAPKLRAVESCNRALRFGLVGHFNEREATGPARIAIGFDAHPLNLTVSFK